MSTLSDIQKEANKIQRTLDKAGIVSKSYVRGPVATEIFTLNLNASNLIRQWPGLADIYLNASKKHRQAVFTVHEGGREITRTYRVHSSYINGEYEAQLQDVELYFPISIPNSTIIDWKIKEEDIRIRNTSYPLVTATKKATESTISFLLGFDETRQFIAQLPRIVNSVSDAHGILRPRTASPKALRQGEWFFVPASKAISEAIERSLAKNPTRKNVTFDYGRIPRVQIEPLEHHSTHWAPIVYYKNVRYAKGTVVDLRGGRHGPLVLDDWHRVVRNAEVAQKEAPRRYWD